MSKFSFLCEKCINLAIISFADTILPEILITVTCSLFIVIFRELLSLNLDVISKYV